MELSTNEHGELVIKYASENERLELDPLALVYNAEIDNKGRSLHDPFNRVDVYKKD